MLLSSLVAEDGDPMAAGLTVFELPYEDRLVDKPTSLAIGTTASQHT